jgi:ABC-type branched-subunit amino acid transport system substrate-binding protein
MARQYAQGAIMTDGFFAESNSVHVKNFVKLFKNIYGKQPGFIEAVAYDTAMIMLQTISQPEIFYRSGLRDALMNLNNYPGVTGLTSFDHNGEVQKKLYLLRIQGKKFVELESD